VHLFCGFILHVGALLEEEEKEEVKKKKEKEKKKTKTKQNKQKNLFFLSIIIFYIFNAEV
jgi:hypothetical protein